MNIDNEKFILIVLNSKSYLEVLRKCNLKKYGNNFKAIKERIHSLNLSTDHFISMNRKSKFDFIDDLEFIISKSFSYAEIIEKVGLKVSGSNYLTLKKKIKELNIDISHFRGKGWNIKSGGIKTIIDLKDILIKNSTYTNTNRLKYRLIKEGYFEHKCYSCNLIEWMGKLIPIQLEHINGINNDNRIENLTILCPNCHALTDTYCGKNIKVKKNNAGVVERYTRRT